MFERLKQLIKAVRQAMIPANKIEELTGATAVYDSTMQSNIDLWRRMYMDDAEWLAVVVGHSVGIRQAGAHFHGNEDGGFDGEDAIEPEEVAR